MTPPALGNGNLNDGKKRKSVRWAGTPSDIVADASSPLRGDSVWFDSPLSVKQRQRSISPASVTSSSSSPSTPEMAEGGVELLRICLMGTGPLETMSLMDRLRPSFGLQLSEKMKPRPKKPGDCLSDGVNRC